MSIGAMRKRFVGRMKNFGSTEAIAITEYGMLVCLLALTLIALLTVVAPGLSAWFGSKTGQITTN
jgi:Flp pilus assembly pilin Flp